MIHWVEYSRKANEFNHNDITQYNAFHHLFFRYLFSDFLKSAEPMITSIDGDTCYFLIRVHQSQRTSNVQHRCFICCAIDNLEFRFSVLHFQGNLMPSVILQSHANIFTRQSHFLKSLSFIWPWFCVWACGEYKTCEKLISHFGSMTFRLYILKSYIIRMNYICIFWHTKCLGLYTNN